MNYNKPDLIERLSAEYVLGTLQGKARDRFERLMHESHRIRSAVWSWENHITPMAATAPAAKVPIQNWISIEKRLGFKHSHGKSQSSSVLWKWWSAASTFACLLMVMLFANQLLSPELPSADRIAMFANNDDQPQWLVTFDSDTGQLKAKAVNAIAVEAGRAFELWALPNNGNPQSLGLLPVSSNTEVNFSANLSPALLEILSSASGLAISIEPEGGSPTGLPTGPVVYQSTLIDL